MPAVTVEPLPPRAFEGLKEPSLLMAAFNRLQEEAGVLNGGLTLVNTRRVVLADKEFVTPSEWTTLTPLTSFTDTGLANGYGPLSVTKQADGTAWLQGRVARASGSPAAFSPIAQLPEGYAPTYTQRRVVDAAGAHGVLEVDATGAIRWVAGTPTTAFYVATSWVAKDKSLPSWATPLRCRLTVDTASPSAIVVRQVLIAARSSNTADAGLTSVTMVHGPKVERVAGERYPSLVVPRIDGLQEQTRYRLTLWAFLE